MSYTELEHFLSKGEEKFFWVLSLKNIAGLAVGTFAGQRLGALLWGHGLLAVATTLGCMALGVVLTLQYHGLLIARRLVIALRFSLRRLRALEFDGTAWLGEDAVPVVPHASWAEQVWVRTGEEQPMLATGGGLPQRAEPIAPRSAAVTSEGSLV